MMNCRLEQNLIICIFTVQHHICSVHHVIPYVQEMPGSNYENIGKKFKNATISSLYKEYLNKFNKNSQIRYTISPFSCLANRKKPKTKSKNPK